MKKMVWMANIKIHTLAAAFLALVTSFYAVTNAQAATFAIDWTGDSGFTIDGSFSFDDSLLNTGAIDETSITAFSFSVLQNGLLQGTAELSAFTSSVTFNFNFDTTSETFLTGGLSAGLTGQSWNNGGVPVGFTSGSGSQGVSIGTSFLLGSISSAQSTLLATRVSAVPLPAALPLFASGLALLGFAGWRRKRVVAA